MSAILDVELRHKFWGDLEAAQKAASIEAANTGGAVITVDAVEIHANSVTFVGTMPGLAINNSLFRETTRIDSFHTTWGAVLNPAGAIGFLVVGHPVNCKSYEITDSHLNRVEVAICRTFMTIPTGTIGVPCCKTCRQPISAERLRARPGVRVCVLCQTLREETIQWKLAHQ